MTARYLTKAGLDELTRQLGERDYAVLQVVTRLRFVSGNQLERLCFAGLGDPAAGARAARRGLLKLVELGLLERPERRVGGVRRGSAGFVYCLAPWGQRLAISRDWLPERRRRRSLVYGTLFVRHVLAVAELHVRLVEGDRAKRFELLELTAEPTCWRSYVVFGGQRLRLKPDSLVRLASGAWESSFFVEVDRGTEGTGALERQMRAYVDYHRCGQEQAEHGVFPRVLWLTPNARRAEAIVDAASRLPAESWQLFQAVPFDAGIAAMTDGDAKKHNVNSVR
jgi:hypothetical protein